MWVHSKIGLCGTIGAFSSGNILWMAIIGGRTRVRRRFRVRLWVVKLRQLRVWMPAIGGLSYHPILDTGIVNNIMDILKRHLPFAGQEGLQELKKIAVRFEEKTYTGATSQSDYLRKISLKMLTMETKSQNPMGNSLQSNAPSNSKI
ncbi:Uncharacterized protein Fot_47126 [Forsythia ovata]|uniref:Mediator complex subunit 15 KIX domain-containing protein n=1 Tax=Forsythia ovata TaxID=205694 RepID=A0ABD1QPH6_9LAMI